MLLLNQKQYDDLASDDARALYIMRYEVWAACDASMSNSNPHYYYGEATPTEIRKHFATEYPGRPVWLIIPERNADV